jgi:hypothetical protein
MIVRLAISALLTLGLGACDTMIADRMIIRTPAEQSAPAPSTPEVLTVTRTALNDCGLAEADISEHRDTLHWKNPKGPPGLHVMLHPVGDGLRVTLAQDLYGPIGPTDAYRCVRKTLRRRLEERYSKERVRLES